MCFRYFWKVLIDPISNTGVAFLGVNNFVTTGAFDVDSQLLSAETTNSLDFANQRIQKCSQLVKGGTYRGDGNVNFLFVDFWSIGDIVEVVQEYNVALGEN